MDEGTLISLIAIFVLLGFSGLFSGSETAMTTASRARLMKEALDGDKGAQRALELIEDKERLIGGILLGNNLVNILASALATSVLITIFGDTGVLYATIIMTALVLIFAEVMPKTYAISNADRMSRTVSPFIHVTILILGPVVQAVQKIVRFTLGLFGVDTSATEVLSAHDEIRSQIDLQASEGGLMKGHKDMLGGILDLDNVDVEDVMVHRRNMLMLDVNSPPETLIAKVIRSPFTRIPVYDGDTENIVGVLHAKDVLRGIRRAGMKVQDVDIRKVMSKPWFVPETTTLREQLDAFKIRRAHFALVVDEYGALMGLITLEDILEEIVGEIEDEHDRVAEGIQVMSDGSVLAEGTVAIRDLNRRFDWALPDEEAITIAGLVINEAMLIPIVGQKFRFFDFTFEVTGRKRNQITEVCIIPPTPADASKAANPENRHGAQ